VRDHPPPRERLVEYVWEGAMKCVHHDICSCNLRMIFRSNLEMAPVLIHRVIEKRLRSREEMMSAALVEMQSLFVIRGGIVMQKHTGLTQDIKIRNAIRATGCTNIREIPAPTERVISAKDDPMQIPVKEVENAAKMADKKMFEEVYGIDKSLNWYSRHVFAPLPELSNFKDIRKKIKGKDALQVPPLLAMVMASQSMYNKAFGGTNGRPHVISAMKGMEDEKVVRIISKHARNTDVITDKLKEVMDNVPEALDYMYSAMDTVKYIATFPPIVTMERVKDMYLGASAGTFIEHSEVKEISPEINLEIKAGRKKYMQLKQC